jgi:hypothetical protein
LERLKALASKGEVKRAKRERVVDVGSDTVMGLNWGLKENLGVDDDGDGDSEGEGRER